MDKYMRYNLAGSLLIFLGGVLCFFTVFYIKVPIIYPSGQAICQLILSAPSAGFLPVELVVFGALGLLIAYGERDRIATLAFQLIAALSAISILVYVFHPVADCLYRYYPIALALSLIGAIVLLIFGLKRS